MESKASVIVPVFNAQRYLDQCIKSVLDQTYGNLELIMVNDGSTDNSYSIMKRYAERDRRIHVISRETKSGSAAVPRNVGLEYATGRYVYFLDADDFIAPKTLELTVGNASDNDSDMVIFNNWNIDENGNKTIIHSELHEKMLPDMGAFSVNDIPDRIFQISNSAIWHRLYNRNFLMKNCIRFQENVPCLDDVSFAGTALVLANKISVVNERLVYYRVESEFSQTKRVTQHYDSVIMELDKLFENVKTSGKYDLVRSSLNEFALSIMNWWLNLIDDYSVYRKLLGIYKNVCFTKWRIENVSVENKPWIEDLYHFLKGDRTVKMLSDRIDTIPQNTRIILYGAGEMGRKLYPLLVSNGYYKVVAWVDKAAENMSDFKQTVVLPEMIKDCAFDYVIITIKDTRATDEIIDELALLGVASDRVIKFWDD